MKTKQFFLLLFILGFIFSNAAFAEREEREVSSFSEISLRISGKVHLEQGNRQSVRVEAKSSTLEEIITEVKGRTLIIRFKSNNIFRRSFNPGRVDIYITVPEINALSVSGSGDIVAESKIKSRILDLAVSGSGDISLKNLDAERIKTAVSGSGDILINKGGVADELEVAISGSGNVKAENFEVKNVEVKIAGSGSCSIYATEYLKAKVSGSGNVLYKGNPQIDTSVVGSGKVKKL
ncbi:head GIN domain-containing protein [Mariniphaga sp.]|uniref:head GIN domain-containing protein n=1 Tax=Mariniphaga sp. TaxID=1954475 RepID=UPI0035643CF7